MPQPAEILRFTLGERWVHRMTAILMCICIATGAVLYVGALSQLFGRRALVEWVHVIAGCCLPVPMLAGLASKAFRADARILNRFTRNDWRWLRARYRRNKKLPIGKFNAGQKLNASFQVGAILMMLSTGLIMRFANHWPLYLRTGATFVHDWIAYAIFAVVAGHLWMANRDPHALRGMRTGYVQTAWARREHNKWAAAEVDRMTRAENADGRAERTGERPTRTG